MLRRLLLFTLLLMGSVILAQESSEPAARGIIYMPDNSSDTEPIILNPLFCRTTTCNTISALLFPTLIRINPATSLPELAADDNYTLVESWEATADGDAYRYTLRDDATWSDGTPITAYDVFFSYLAIINENTSSDFENYLDGELAAVIPIDDRTVLMMPDENDCETLVDTSFPVIPVHVFDETFATRVQDHFTAENMTLTDFESWRETDDFDYGAMQVHPFSYEPIVSYGPYQLDSQSTQEYIRLTNVNSPQVIETVRYSRGQSGMDAVIAGDIAYYLDPPRDEWHDLRNNPQVQAITMPPDTWYYIAFNFSDPDEPLSYRDEDGEVQEQEPHPILVNRDVRRAIQLGINAQELVDVVLWGEGDVMSGHMLPASWAYNPDLKPVGNDPDLAKQLLEAAGWRQIDPFGARTCLDCGTTSDNARLSLTMLYDTGSITSATAQLVRDQLAKIGVDVQLNGDAEAFNQAQFQQFDLYLGGWQLFYPVSANISWFFSPEEDNLGDGFNFGSYDNPDLLALNDEARTLDGCDIEERRALYQEIERQVQEDQPYVWLFYRNEMAVYHESIQHVETYPLQPLANIHEWSVWKMP